MNLLFLPKINFSYGLFLFFSRCFGIKRILLIAIFLLFIFSFKIIEVIRCYVYNKLMLDYFGFLENYISIVIVNYKNSTIMDCKIKLIFP